MEKNFTSSERQSVSPDWLLGERPVVVVESGFLRTPFAKAPGKLSGRSSLELAQHVVAGIVARLNLDARAMDELILGTVLPNPLDANIARHVVFRAGLPRHIYAYSATNNCITGLVAIDLLAKDIALGRATLGIAGGVESMSNVPLPLRAGAQEFWRNLATAKTFGRRLQALAGFRPSYLVPLRPRPTEPFTGLTMGEHCEQMNRQFKIDRSTQDQIALRSHQRAARAAADGTLAAEIAPIDGIAADTGIRADTSLEALGKLPPVFDKRGAGTITAGNASFPTDGAAAVCLMSLDQARRLGYEPLAYLRGFEFAAIDPDDGLLMAPALALPRLLSRHGLTANDIDLFEIHEAFAAQVAANVQVWERGWEKFPGLQPIGQIDWEKVNVNGGSLAIGHPFAATGPRLLMALAAELKRRSARWGVLSACAAGGAGCAMLVENVR